MRLSLGRILADAWHILRGEADLIVRVAAPFVFLPAFAVQLLVVPPPALPGAPRDPAAMQAWLTRLTDWGADNAGWYLLADAIGVFGLAALAILLIDRDRPNVQIALGEAARRYGRFVLASILASVPVGLGLWLFILPGLYVQARLIAVLPALVAEAPLSAVRAIGRSWRITRGDGFAILSAVVTLFIAQYLVLAPLLPADDYLRVPANENPFVRALVDALLAGAASAYHVGMLVIGVAIYRRLVRSGT